VSDFNNINNESEIIKEINLLKIHNDSSTNNFIKDKNSTVFVSIGNFSLEKGDRYGKYLNKIKETFPKKYFSEIFYTKAVKNVISAFTFIFGFGCLIPLM